MPDDTDLSLDDWLWIIAVVASVVLVGAGIVMLVRVLGVMPIALGAAVTWLAREIREIRRW
jgi:hypothetical protein